MRAIWSYQGLDVEVRLCVCPGQSSRAREEQGAIQTAVPLFPKGGVQAMLGSKG